MSTTPNPDLGTKVIPDFKTASINLDDAHIRIVRASTKIRRGVSWWHEKPEGYGSTAIDANIHQLEQIIANAQVLLNFLKTARR